MSDRVILSTGVFDDDWETQTVAVPSADGTGVVLMVQTRLHEGGRWHVNSGGVESLTWPDIRRLASLDPESPMPRVRAIWERITAYPEWHSDANGETMLVVSDDAMAEMDAALDPGTDRLRQVVSDVAEWLSNADCGGNMGVALTMSQCSEKLRMALGWREDEFGNFGPPMDPGTEGGGE